MNYVPSGQLWAKKREEPTRYCQRCRCAIMSQAQGVKVGSSWVCTRCWNSPNKTTKAFTLIELLVVIATIAVILAIALPALAGARQRARDARCLSNLRSIGTFTSHFVDANNRLPDPFNMDDEVPDLRCPRAVDPDTGVYGFPGQMPASGVFMPTTWIGRSITLNPAKVSVVMCSRHAPYQYGFLDGHAR